MRGCSWPTTVCLPCRFKAHGKHDKGWGFQINLSRIFFIKKQTMLAIEAASFTLRIGASFSTSGKKWYLFRHLGYGPSGIGSPRNSHSGAQPLDCTFFRSCDSESWFNLFGGMDKKPISWDRPLNLFNDAFFFVKITFHQKVLPQKPSRWKVVQYLVDQPLWLLGTQDCGCSSFYLVQYL